MNTIPRVEPPLSERAIPLESTSQTRRAAIYVTLGLPLKHVAILYNAEHPKKSTGGTAHFVFATDLGGLAKLHEIYDVGDADTRLDELLKQAKTDPALTAFVTELEKHLAPALLVWGRRFLENNSRLLEFLRDEAPEFKVSGGTPVYDFEGRHVGMQGFTVRYHKR